MPESVLQYVRNNAGFFLNAVAFLIAVVFSFSMAIAEKGNNQRNSQNLSNRINEIVQANPVSRNEFWKVIVKAEVETALRAYWGYRLSRSEIDNAQKSIRENRSSKNTTFVAQLDEHVAIFSNTLLDSLENPTSSLNVEKEIERASMAWFSETSVYANNYNSYIVWTILAIIYVIIGLMSTFRSDRVIVSIDSKNVKIPNSNTEGVLNIIDVGFYLTLLGFTAGIGSPWYIRTILILSICSALTDLRRTYRKFQNSFSPHEGVKEFLEFLGNYSNMFLYMFFFWNGIVWLNLGAELENVEGMFAVIKLLTLSAMDLAAIIISAIPLYVLLHLIQYKILGNSEYS